MQQSYCTNLPVLKGQKVRIKGSGRTYIAENDIISNPVLIVGDRAIGKDSSRLKLKRNNQLFKSKTQKIQEAQECELKASSLLSAIASFPYNPESTPDGYFDANYDFNTWQIETLQPDSIPYTSWTFNSNAEQCQAVEDGSGEYADLNSCLVANQQAEPSKIAVSGSTQNELIHVNNDFSGNLSDRSVYTINSAWAYRNHVFNTNFQLGSTFTEDPLYPYDIWDTSSISQSYRLRFILLIDPALAGTGKFYEAIYGHANDANINFVISYFINNRLTTGQLINLPDPNLGVGFSPTFTEAIINTISPIRLAVDQLEYNLSDLLGIDLPLGVPVPVNPIQFAGGSANFVWINNLAEKMPRDDYNLWLQSFPDATYPLNGIFLKSRIQSQINQTLLLSNIDYQHIINSGYINYFVKIHDPNLPVTKVLRVPENKFHRLFLIFLGDRAFIIVKIGKLRNSAVSLDQRPWYQVKIIELIITDTELTVEPERDYFYPTPIEITPGVLLENANEIVIRNKLGYLDDPTINPSACFDAEKYYAGNYFLETNFKLGGDGRVYEYKVPGTLYPR